MKSQRQSRIVFEGELRELFGAAERPQAWPSFLSKSQRWKRNCQKFDSGGSQWSTEKLIEGLFSLLKVSRNMGSSTRMWLLGIRPGFSSSLLTKVGPSDWMSFVGSGRKFKIGWVVRTESWVSNRSLALFFCLEFGFRLLCFVYTGDW